MGYQSFPWAFGSSYSLAKLYALNLPELKGKRVLDVGCNAGYFCGWAKYKGAKYVKGIDNNNAWLEEARKLFPDCTFECCDWDNLNEEKFDVILFLSAIHYSRNWQDTIDILMSRRDKNGVLVLETGIAPGENCEFVKVERSIDTLMFPTKSMLEKMLSKYVFKYIQKSVDQEGDPLPRHVYHIHNKKPLAILLLDRAYSGKTTVANTVLSKDIQKISGDLLVWNIQHHVMEMSEKMHSVIDGIETINLSLLMERICQNDLLHEYIGLLVREAKGNSFVYDGYVPEPYREMFSNLLDVYHFFVMNISMCGRKKQDAMMTVPKPDEIDGYEKLLIKKYGFDEEAYLAANHDVAEAVANKQLKSGAEHYFRYGKFENRRLK